MTLELRNVYVKRGLWTNLDEGPIMGKTITTDSQTGNLVVAIVAVVSTLGTAHLWHLITFAYHQIRATGRASDGLFRQQQALLRTLPPPSSVMTDAFKLWWSWRKATERAFLRSFLLIGLALIFTTATIAASVFSSQIVKAGIIPVLVDSPLCGGYSNFSQIFQSQVALMAPSMMDTCYESGRLQGSCQMFMQPNIPLTMEDAPCPFNDTNWCATKEAVSLDTGLLDIGKTFGLNLKAKDRTQFRRKTVCTVLPIEGAYDVVNVSDHPELATKRRDLLPNEQMLLLYYGPNLYNLKKAPGTTFGFSLFTSNVTGKISTEPGLISSGDPERRSLAEASWIPKDGMKLEEGSGDQFIKIVMPNGMVYNGTVDDPLFSAHRPVRESNVKADNASTVYLPDHPVKAVSCTQHHQICHAREGKEDFCTPFAFLPWHRLRDGIDFPEANDMQRVILSTFLEASWLFPTGNSRLVKATSITTGSIVPVLPNGQWKKEVLAWEQTALASLQMSIPQYAIGPQALEGASQTGWAKPETPAEKALCTAQKMKKDGNFVNINVFGLIFILTASLLFLILDLSLLKFLIYLSRFRLAFGPRIERWIQDGVWQLQRRAYEGEGYRNWTNLEEEVPVMEKGKGEELLKDLPITWVPGKSPGMVQTRTFGSVQGGTESRERLRPGTGRSASVSVSASANGDVDVEEQQGEKNGRRWYLFWKR